MKFLYHLSKVFCHYETHKEFPSINFQALPQTSDARWNSRAILALLMPQSRENGRFQHLFSFIAGPWSDVWFSDQREWRIPIEKLSPVLEEYPKAKKCFETHWVKQDSVLPGIERSNRCAERAIKILQDIFPNCRSNDKLNDRFILTNQPLDE